LLHFQNQTAEITTDECVSKLMTHIQNYRKGALDNKLKDRLSYNKDNAVLKAKSLPRFANPFTDVYLFIEKLDKMAYTKA
jgi:hypothetical protein